MKRPSLKSASILLNGILLSALLLREGQHRLLRFRMEMETEMIVPSWAKYAGTMQAMADYANGVRRFYRPTLSTGIRQSATFTGQLDGGAEVWSWIYYRELGEADRLSAVAFTDAYNARMKNCMNDPAYSAMNGVAATQQDSDTATDLDHLGDRIVVPTTLPTQLVPPWLRRPAGDLIDDRPRPRAAE